MTRPFLGWSLQSVQAICTLHNRGSGSGHARYLRLLTRHEVVDENVAGDELTTSTPGSTTDNQHSSGRASFSPVPLSPRRRSERSGPDFRRGVPARAGRSSRCHRRRRRRRRRRRCPGNTHFLLCPRNLEDHFPTLSPRVAALPSG